MADTKTKPADLGTLATIDIAQRTVGIPGDNLCAGVPLFPFGMVDFGHAGSHVLVNASPTILLMRYAANISARYAVGVCGPAYAFELTAQGTLEDVSDPEQGPGQKLTLDLSDSQASAGFFMGDQEGIYISLGLSIEYPELVGSTWHKHFEWEWETVASLSLPIRFSLIALIIDVIKLIIAANKDNALEEQDNPTLSNSVKNAFNDAAVNTIKTFVMYANSADKLSSSGSTRLEPTLAYNINILPYIEGVGEIIEALKDIGATLAAGPSFQLGIPVSIDINEAYINCEKFGDGFSIDSGVLQATRYSSEPIASVESVALGVQNTPSFDFRVGLFASFSWLKFLNLAPSFTISVTDLLGLDIPTGTYSHIVDDQGRVDACSGASAVEIVFEDHH